MKNLNLYLLAAVVLSVSPAIAQRFQQEAVLIFDDRVETVWIADANKAKFLYYETEKAVDRKTMLNSQPKSIWLMEPPEFSAAMELFQGQKYEEARSKFAEVRQTYLPLQTLPDNHSSLSALYEMECLRKLGKLDELAKAQETWLPDDRNSLTREHHLAQLELYKLWDAARTQDWPRLELMGNERIENKMPGYQRAQVAYCLGLALEGQQKSFPAIDAYNIAMTADTGASEQITRLAAENAMRLYLADEEVQQAMRLWGTPDEKATSRGALRLETAASLAELYELTLGAGATLSEDSKVLLKYAPSKSSDAAGSDGKAASE